MIAIYSVIAIVFVFCVLSLLFLGTFPFDNSVGIYIFILFISMVMMIIRYVRTIEINYKRDLENSNGEPVKIKMILTNDKIETCRVNSDSKTKISYQAIRKIIATHNYYVLLTEANQYIALKKDGFIKGTPDEFMSFINSKVNKLTKKSKTQIVLICLASIIALSIAVSLYFVNGRTVFENRKEPSETELKKINEIISFEQEKLSECKEILSRYDNRANELGIEIRPELDQERAVNQQGLVEKHDWNKDRWLPQFYSSKIVCYVYKDGKMLTEKTSYNTTSYFVDIFWLLNAGKDDEITFNENPFDHFDIRIDNLLNQVSSFLQK